MDFEMGNYPEYIWVAQHNHKSIYEREAEVSALEREDGIMSQGMWAASRS